VTPKVRTGGLGQLDVTVDGTVVFSRKAANRFPERGEIVRLAKAVSS
jgi:predicted Rdx family selenoprotein